MYYFVENGEYEQRQIATEITLVLHVKGKVEEATPSQGGPGG
jgi:hypothetical protein